MRVRPMKEIRNWAAGSGRWIEKDGTRLVLVSANNRSRPMERPRFRRACTRMMGIEGRERKRT